MEQVSRGRAIAAAIGCALILTTGTGTTTVLNAMIPDLLEGTNATLSMFMIGPTLATIGAFLGSLVATKAINRITPKWSLLLGSVTVSAVLAMIALATNVYLWIVANVLNGVVLSFGAHAAASGVVARFYGRRTQAAYGFVAGGYYVLTALEVFLVAFLLSVADYRTVLWTFSGLSLAVGLFSNLVLIGRVPAGSDPGPEATCDDKVHRGITLRQALRTPSFYLLCAVIFLGAWALDGTSAFSTVFFTAHGVSNADAAAFLGVHTMMGAVLMIAAGVITNRFGCRTTALVVFVCYALGIGMLLAWAQTGAVPLAYTGMAFASTILMVSILSSLFILDLFGMKDYVSINAAVMSAYFLGNASAMAGLARVTDLLGVDRAFMLIVLLVMVAMACMLLSYVLRPMKKIQADCEAAACKAGDAPAVESGGGDGAGRVA